jgi:hypothetical protein
MDARTGCPTGDHLFTAYEELFTAYFDMVKAIVYRSGIAPEDVEDVSMEIITTFMKKGALEKYDPNMKHVIKNPVTPGGNVRTAKFKGMLSGFTRVYVMAHRDKQMMRHRKEPFRLEHRFDEDISDSDQSDNGFDYVQAASTSNPIEQHELSLSIRGAVLAARKEIVLRQAARDAAKTRSKKNLVACFDLLVSEGWMSGRITRLEASIRLGVSETSVGTMIKEIKQVLGAELSAAQVALP